MKIQQIRNATITLDYGGTKFLIDPIFSEKGAFVSFPSFEHEEVKNPLTDLPLPVDEITKDVDYVIVTHTHVDHWDPKAAETLNKDLPILVQDKNDRDVITKSGFKNVKIVGEKEELNGVTLIRRPTQHFVNAETEKVLADLTDGVTDVMGLIFKAENEKILYLTADTIYYDGVKETIDRFSPEVIIANAGGNTFKIDENKDNGRLILNASDIHEIHKDAPESTIVATHMEAINHYMTSRADLKNIAAENNFTNKLLVPEDGEIVEI